MTQSQRSEAAQKAVATKRYQHIEQIENLPALIQLTEDIRTAEFEFQDDQSKESFIAKNIGATTYRSFTRFGDRNKVSLGFVCQWIRLNGIPLDEQAMFMSNDYGSEILPEELAGFMMDCDRGASMHEPIRKITEMKRIFKEITGFNYNYSWIKLHLVVDEPINPHSELPF